MKRAIKAIVIILVVLVVLFAAGLVAYRYAYNAYLKLAYPLKYEEIVEKYATEYEVSPSLIYAVINVESRFREDAVSKADAKGLMQLTDETYRWIQTKLPGEPLSIEFVFDPEVNIRCGTKLLAVLQTMFSEPETIVAAYNAGSGKVKTWLRDPAYSTDGKALIHIPYEETANYVNRVMKTQKQYQTLYGIE